jgi:transposase
MKKVSVAMKIGLATVHRWLKPIKHEKTQKPRFSDILVEFVKTIISQKPFSTHKDIVIAVNNDLGLKVSRQCISSILKSLGYSRKRAKKRTVVNKDNQFNKKIDFINRCDNIKFEKVVSIDEVGFDPYTLPIYGYSKKGTPVFVKRHQTRRQRLNVIMAIDSIGKIHYQIVKGNVTSDIFSQFIDSLPWSNISILMDNASIHRTERVKQLLENKGFQSLFIPPYSPELNPIEYVFSSIKNEYRKSAINTQNQPLLIFKNLINKFDKQISKNCFDHVEKLIATLKTTLV